MPVKLQGKIAVITGGNSGIGRATAKRFVAEGATVFITGRRQEDLDATLKAIGGDITAVRGDVARLEDLDDLFEVVRRRAGRIDVLFANAGGGEFAPLGQITEAHFDSIFATNVKGVLFTVQKALPLMRAGGSVIITGSTAASTGVPAFSVYAASKAALRAFARNWILDLKGTGIRVNVLAPGATSTPGWHGLAPSQEVQRKMIQAVESTTPLGRLGDPDEVAAAALFLASEDSSFVNGIELFVDGGSAQI
ncbi:SDR family oxidoreductase [Alsobacter sp. KACC 23698]|uniref:SDR family oxidoreductase n=1 Tax=Alsobacter sp. KACC 23698 TaxID=3149229 RepID=A0AAU7JKL2_9HYPH